MVVLFSYLYLGIPTVQSLSHVQLYANPWIAAFQASLSFSVSLGLLRFLSMESIMLSNHLILCHPLLLLLQYFPAPESLPMSRLSASDGQSTGASASVLPMNIQDWFPLGLTGLISCTPRDSQESSSAPQFKSINSLPFSFLYGPTLTSIHDCWKNHNFDYNEWKKKQTGNREKYVTIPVRKTWCCWRRHTHTCVNMQDRSSASVRWHGHVDILLMCLCLWSVSAFPILVVKYLKYYSCVYVLENTPQHTVSIFGWVLGISTFFSIFF